MDTIKTLEDILTKTVKNTNNQDRKRAVEALQALFLENGNHKQVIEYIFKFHYSVCEDFFKSFCLSASDEDIFMMINEMINNEQFINGNHNNIMCPKGFSAVLALASKDKYQAALLVLNKILFTSENSAGFTKSCINNFNKLIIKENNISLIMNIYEQMKKGEITCQESEKSRLSKFLKFVNDKSTDTSCDKESTTLKTEQPLASIPINLQSNDICVTVKHKDKIAENKEEIDVTKIEKKIEDIFSAIYKLSDNQSSVDKLTTSISMRDKEIVEIKTKLVDKEHHIDLLANEIKLKEKQITEKDDQIADLTERLRMSLQMDDISKNQKLITLKNDISEALKLDYTDFIKSKQNQYSVDLFEAYRATLTRIFKLLKRFEISCE